MTRFHYGSELPNVSASSHSLFNKLGSEWAREQMSAAERPIEESRAEQAKERALQANKQIDEWVAQYFRLDSWLFWTIVDWQVA